jgi:2-polyprenyl-3-methyl-5-hydroxy-6-metoxy-1,4-benzoquinol methylase
MDRMYWTPEDRACPLCGGSEHRVLGHRGGEAHRARLGIRTASVRCRTCHGVYSRPFLLPDGNPYAQHSAAEYFAGQPDDDKIAAGEMLAKRAERLLGRTGRLLEIGCGAGGLLLGARAAGWSVHGVEMTSGFVDQARSRGLDVECAAVETCRSLHDGWDVIVLAAVLEHLYEPRACLNRVFDALVPGGLAFVDVPNECSTWTRLGNAYMRLRGRSWAVNLSPTFPPYHVVGFCPRSLARLTRLVGFETVEMKTCRYRNDFPVAATVMGKVERLGAEAALTIGAWLGSGAGLDAWLRKPVR